MGLDVIAEGVEKEIQLNYLLGHGCHLIQGQYFNSSFPEMVLMRILDEQEGYPLANSITSDFPVKQLKAQYWMKN
jgi:sensor c-di-GMP phosphodiesterase-like protein